MKARKLGVTLLSLVLLTSLIMLPLATAKPGQVTVRVRYVDQKGKEKAASGKLVTLTDEAGNVLEGVTDEKGKALITGTEGSTTYTIKIDGKNYHSFTTTSNGGAGVQKVEIPP